MTTKDETLIKVAGLYENESANGNRYYVGYCGPLKYLIFKNRDQQDGSPGWTLFVTQRPDKTAE